MFKRIFTIFLLLLGMVVNGYTYIYISMDDLQSNHLKAYGLAYQALELGIQVKWLLNYEGGSFLITQENPLLITWAITRNVSYELIDEAEWVDIQAVIDYDNMNIVDLDVAPKVAIYVPPWNAPWDDAVNLVLEYAEIPYTTLWDEEVLSGGLTTDNYDWLHLHHEDFTGQYGKFWYYYSGESWYVAQVVEFQDMAESLGYATVQEEKKEVAQKIREYVTDGGFLFAMCSATDTLDIGLATVDIDIIPSQIDGTPYNSAWREQINYDNCLAFENFTVETSPWEYEFSDIDISAIDEGIYYTPFYMKLNEFSAKYDIVPSMLVQNHKNVFSGYLGQTTAYHTEFIKKDIIILNEIEGADWVTYIHGYCGEGTFTFLAGHDPEDYAHMVGDPPTNLDLFPNSPGYRLILNNILFPAANTEERKT